MISNKAVKGGSNIVARIRLRGRARASGHAFEPAWERALRIRGEAMNEVLR